MAIQLNITSFWRKICSDPDAPRPEYTVVTPNYTNTVPVPVLIKDAEAKEDESSSPSEKELKKRSFGLRGKKTRVQRAEEGTKFAAIIVAEAVRDVTNIHKKLKLMELK